MFGRKIIVSVLMMILAVAFCSETLRELQAPCQSYQEFPTYTEQCLCLDESVFYYSNFGDPEENCSQCCPV